jgi:hypothetical protein
LVVAVSQQLYFDFNSLEGHLLVALGQLAFRRIELAAEFCLLKRELLDYFKLLDLCLQLLHFLSTLAFSRIT